KCKGPPGGTSSSPLIRFPQSAESKSRITCSPEPLMVGMDLECTETRSRLPGTPKSGRGVRQRLPQGESLM
ncbi:unnamed protein product, partial [Staurois parvus]